MARRIAVVRDYESLLQAIRLRMSELNITQSVVDDVSGVQSGYTGKLLCSPPIKRLGMMSLGAVLGTIGMQLVAVEDPFAIG
jgi:hypothetical protein